MKKHIKAFALLLVAATSMMVFASCSKDKEDTTANQTANGPASVADTEWSWRTADPENATGMLDVSVEFNGPMLASLDYTDFSTGILQSDALIGTYSYSGGSGTLSLDDDGSTLNIPFTVTETTMKLTFRGTAYTLTKE